MVYFFESSSAFGFYLKENKFIDSNLTLYSVNVNKVNLLLVKKEKLTVFLHFLAS